MNVIKNFLNSSLFRSAFIYGMASAVNSALPFLLLPILTRYLSPSDYGLVTIFTTLVTFYNVLVGLNVAGAAFNKFFFTKDHPDYNFSDYISNIIIILFSATAVTTLLTAVFLPQIINLTELSSQWIFTALFAAFFQQLILIKLSLFQAAQKPKSYGYLLCTQSLINIVLSITAVIGLSLYWQGRVASITIAFFVVGIYSLISLIKEYKPSLKFKKTFALEALKFGVPLVPHTLGAIFISLADRFIITKLTNVGEAGLYQAGVQISMAILFLADAFNKAYAPWLYSTLKKNSEELNKKVVKLTYLYFVLIIGISTVFAILPESLYTWILGEKFRNAKDYIAWSAYAYAFHGMYMMVCNYIFYSERTQYLAYITLPLGIFNIYLSYTLTQQIGAKAAAISMCISYFLMFIFTWILSARLIKMPWTTAFKN